MAVRLPASEAPLLSVAFVLLPEFTLSAFAGFVDTLRLSADDNFASGQKYSRWTVLHHDLNPVRSSCGAMIVPWGLFDDPSQYDCIVVVGGLVKGHEKIHSKALDFIARAHERGVLCIGVCTGSFALAYAGLMERRTTCVHWFHKPDFQKAFPGYRCVTDVVFLEDDGCITAAGGGVASDVAAVIIERFCGRARARIGLSGMLMDSPKGICSPQPHFEAEWFNRISRPELRRSILIMDRNVRRYTSVRDLARLADMSKSQMDRLFKAELGVAAGSFNRHLRLGHANMEVLFTKRTITDIAMEYSFSDASHFTKTYNDLIGLTPTAARAMDETDALEHIATSLANKAPVIQALMAGQLMFSSFESDTGAIGRFDPMKTSSDQKAEDRFEAALR